TGRSPGGFSRACAHTILGGFNRLRHSPMVRETTDLAIGQIAAYDFALVTLFISVAEQRRQLDAAGFQVEAVLEPDGTELPADGGRESDAEWHYYVARKPA